MKPYSKTLAAFCSLLFFIQSIHPAPALGAKPNWEISVPQFTLSDLKKASTIPSPQKIFQGNSRGAVLLIQDAHSNPQAQTSIEAIIQALHHEFGIKTLAVEGGTGEMDTSLLKACPSEKKVERLLDELIQKGELSGIVPASVLNKSSLKVLGIENEEKYKIQLEKYLKASDLHKKNQLLLASEIKEIETLKTKFYPKKLLYFENILNQFNSDSSQFQLLLKVFSEETDLKKYKNLSSFQIQLEEEKSTFEIPEIIILEKAIKEMSLTTDQAKQLSYEKQAFRTHQKSGIEYVSYLVSLSRSLGLNIPVSEDLKVCIDHFKESHNVKAILFMEEIEKASEEVYAKYLSSKKLKNLRKQDQDVHLAKRISSLEVTDKEWKKIEDQNLNINEVDLSAARSFYETANERDQIFSEELVHLARKETVMFVAGGFHTQAIADHLKKQKVSYAIFSPEASSGLGNYDALMRGDISWKKYLKPKSGKINVYESFSRMMIEKIAGKDWDFLMNWRRQVILNLANEGRLAEASKYTSLIDELAPGVMTEEKARELKLEWIKKLEDFASRFSNSLAVSPSAVPTIFEKPLFSRSEIRSDFHYADLPTNENVQRSEIRSTENLLDNFSVEVLGGTVKFWEGTTKNFRRQAIYELCRKVRKIRRDNYTRNHQNGEGARLVQPQFEIAPHELVRSDFNSVNIGSNDSRKTLSSLLNYYEGLWSRAGGQGELIDFLLKDLELLRFERFREWPSDMEDLSGEKIQRVSELLGFLAGDRSRGTPGREWDESSALFIEREPVNLAELVQRGVFRSRWYDGHINNGDFSGGVFHELGFRTGGLINETRRHFYEMIALASIVRGLSREPHIFYNLVENGKEPLKERQAFMKDIQAFGSLDSERKKQLAKLFLEREEVKNNFQFREDHELISIEDLTTRLYGHIYLNQVKQIYYWQHLLNRGMRKLNDLELANANLQEETISSFEDKEENGILKTYRLGPDQTHGYLIEVKDQKVVGFYELLIDGGKVLSKDKLKLMKKEISYDSNLGYEDWGRRIGKKVKENIAKPVVGEEKTFFEDVNVKVSSKGKVSTVKKQEWVFSILHTKQVLGIEIPVMNNELPKDLRESRKGLRIGRFSFAKEDIGYEDAEQKYTIYDWAQIQEEYFSGDASQISFYEYDRDSQTKKRLWSYRLNKEGLATTIDIFNLKGDLEKTIELTDAITEEEWLSVEWLRKLEGDYRETLMPLAKEIIYWNDRETPAFKLMIKEGVVKSVVKSIKFEAEQDFYKVDVLLEGKLPTDLKSWNQLLETKDPLISSEATASKADEEREAINEKYRKYRKIINQAIKVYSDYREGKEIDIQVPEMKEVEDLFEKFLFTGLSGVFGEVVLDYEKLMRNYQTAIGIAQNPFFYGDQEKALALKNIFFNPAGFIPSDKISDEDIDEFVKAVLRPLSKQTSGASRSEVRGLRSAIEAARNLEIKTAEVSRTQRKKLIDMGIDPIKSGYNGENFDLLVSDYRNPAWQSALWLASYFKDKRDSVEPILEHDSTQALHHAYHEKRIAPPVIVNLQDNKIIRYSLIPNARNNRGNFGWKEENLETYISKSEHQNQAGLVALLFSLNQKVGDEHNQEIVKILKQSLTALKPGGRIAITLSPTRSFNRGGLEQLKALGVEIEKEGIGFNEFEDAYRNQLLSANGEDTDDKVIKTEDAIRRRQFYVLILKKKEEQILAAPTDKIVIDRVPFIEDPPEGKPGLKPSSLTLDREGNEGARVRADQLTAAFIPRTDIGDDPNHPGNYKTFGPEDADMYQNRFHERRLKLIHKFRRLILLGVQSKGSSNRDKITTLLDQTYFDEKEPSKATKQARPLNAWKIKRFSWNLSPGDEHHYTYSADGKPFLTIHYSKSGEITKISKHIVNDKGEIVYTQPLTLKQPHVWFDSTQPLEHWTRQKDWLYDEVTDKRELRARKEIYKSIDEIYGWLEQLFPVIKEHPEFGELFDDEIAENLKEIRDGTSRFCDYFEREDLEEIQALIRDCFVLWEGAPRFFEKNEAETYLELRKLLRSFHKHHAKFLEGIVSYLSAYSGAAYIKELLSNPEFQLKLADLAAGSGALAHALKRQNVAAPDGDRFQYTEVDIEKKYLDQPRPEGYTPPSVKQVVGDVTKLSEIPELQGETFNLLTLFFILDLLKPADRKKLFIGMNQILELEGQALLAVPQSWQLSEEFLDALKELGFEISIPIRGRQRAKDAWLDRIREHYKSDPDWKDRVEDIVNPVRKMREKEFTILKIKKVRNIDPESESIRKIEDENFEIQKKETEQRGRSDGSKPNNYDPKLIARWAEILNWVLNRTEDDIEVFNPYREDEIVTKQEAIELFPELNTEKAMDALYQYRFLFSPSQGAQSGNLHEKIANMKIYWEGSSQFFREDILLLKELYHTGPPKNAERSEFKAFSVSEINDVLRIWKGHYEQLGKTDKKLHERNERVVNEISALQTALSSYFDSMKQAHPDTPYLWPENSDKRNTFLNFKKGLQDTHQKLISIRALNLLPDLVQLFRTADNQLLAAISQMESLDIPDIDREEVDETAEAPEEESPDNLEGILQSETSQKDIYAIVEKVVSYFEGWGRINIELSNKEKENFEFPTFDEVIGFLQKYPDMLDYRPAFKKLNIWDDFLYEQVKLNYYRLATLRKIEQNLRLVLAGVEIYNKTTLPELNSRLNVVGLKPRKYKVQAMGVLSVSQGSIGQIREVSLGSLGYPFSAGGDEENKKAILGMMANHFRLQQAGIVINRPNAAYNSKTRFELLTLNDPPKDVKTTPEGFEVLSFENYLEERSDNLTLEQRQKLTEYIKQLQEEATKVRDINQSDEMEQLFGKIEPYEQIYPKNFGGNLPEEIKAAFSDKLAGQVPIASARRYFEWYGENFLSAEFPGIGILNAAKDDFFSDRKTFLFEEDEMKLLEELLIKVLDSKAEEWEEHKQKLLNYSGQRNSSFRALYVLGFLEELLTQKYAQKIQTPEERRRIDELHYDIQSKDRALNILEASTVTRDNLDNIKSPSIRNSIYRIARKITLGKIKNRPEKIESKFLSFLREIASNSFSEEALGQASSELLTDTIDKIEKFIKKNQVNNWEDALAAFDQTLLSESSNGELARVIGASFSGSILRDGYPQIKKSMLNTASSLKPNVLKQLVHIINRTRFETGKKRGASQNTQRVDDSLRRFDDSLREIWKAFLNHHSFDPKKVSFLYDFLQPNDIGNLHLGTKEEMVKEEIRLLDLLITVTGEWLKEQKDSEKAKIIFENIYNALNAFPLCRPLFGNKETQEPHAEEIRNKLNKFKYSNSHSSSPKLSQLSLKKPQGLPPEKPQELPPEKSQELSPEQVQSFLTDSNWEILLKHMLLDDAKREQAVVMTARLLLGLESAEDLKSEFEKGLLALLNEEQKATVLKWISSMKDYKAQQASRKRQVELDREVKNTLMDNSIRRDIQQALRRGIQKYREKANEKLNGFVDLENSGFDFRQFKNHPILKDYDTKKGSRLYQAVERNFMKVLKELVINKDASKLDDPRTAAQSFRHKTRSNEKWKVTELEYRTIEGLVEQYLNADAINRNSHLENLKQYVLWGDEWSVIARRYLVGTMIPRLAALRDLSEADVKNLGTDYPNFAEGPFSDNLRDKFLEAYLLLELAESPFMNPDDRAFFLAASFAIMGKEAQRVKSPLYSELLNLPREHLFRKYAVMDEARSEIRKASNRELDPRVIAILAGRKVPHIPNPLLSGAILALAPAEVVAIALKVEELNTENFVAAVEWGKKIRKNIEVDSQASSEVVLIVDKKPNIASISAALLANPNSKITVLWKAEAEDFISLKKEAQILKQKITNFTQSENVEIFVSGNENQFKNLLRKNSIGGKEIITVIASQGFRWVDYEMCLGKAIQIEHVLNPDDENYFAHETILLSRSSQAQSQADPLFQKVKDSELTLRFRFKEKRIPHSMMAAMTEMAILANQLISSAA